MVWYVVTPTLNFVMVLPAKRILVTKDMSFELRNDIRINGYRPINLSSYNKIGLC